jgi:hypothetical protein
LPYSDLFSSRRLGPFSWSSGYAPNQLTHSSSLAAFGQARYLILSKRLYSRSWPRRSLLLILFFTGRAGALILNRAYHHLMEVTGDRKLEATIRRTMMLSSRAAASSTSLPTPGAKPNSESPTRSTPTRVMRTELLP